MATNTLTHTVLTAFDCDFNLHDVDAITSFMTEAALAVGLTVLGSSVQPYAPHGATIVVFLAESHVLLSTWPEHRYAYLDILSCGAPDGPPLISTFMQSKLKPARIEEQESNHRIAA